MEKRMKSMVTVIALGLFLAFAAGNGMAEEDLDRGRPPMADQGDSDDMRGPGRGGPGGGMHGDMPRGQWWRMPGAAEKLGLNQEEQKQLDSLYMIHRREMITLKSAVEKEKLEFEYLIEKETIDEKAIKAQFTKLHDARGKMSMARFTFLLEVRKLLGYERYQKLKSEFQQRKMMRGDGGERRPMREDRGGPRR